MKQRTPLQAYKRILSRWNARKLGAQSSQTCLYRAVKDGVETNCGVGCLFSKDQLDWLENRKLNRCPISNGGYWSETRCLEDVVGVKNLEFVTGLSINELSELQGIHDNSAWNHTLYDVHGKFISHVLAKIKKLKS